MNEHDLDLLAANLEAELDKCENREEVENKGLEYVLYPRSVQTAPGGEKVFMAAKGGEDYIIAPKSCRFMDGYSIGEGLYAHPLNHENAVILMELFPFTAPQRVLNKQRVVGLGDRLGLAGPGHIRAASQYDITPVFAQQSAHMLELSGRSFADVIDSAAFAVFRDGYTRSYGADGDHLSTPEEIIRAINSGCTMITLDCTGHIRSDVDDMTDDQVRKAYSSEARFEREYLRRSFDVGGHTLAFDEIAFKRMVLIYYRAISFISNMYVEIVSRRDVDFEISLDETLKPTTPEQHFFIAHALRLRGVKFDALAPKYAGEFNPGSDYIGDIAEFEENFKAHARIAEHFGYKLAVHNASDKFAIYPIIADVTKGNFHVKTSGTSYIEAMRLIAMKAPKLYREIHAYMLLALDEIMPELKKAIMSAEELEDLSDQELPVLFDMVPVRNMVYITFGAVIADTDEFGKYLFRDRLYDVWHENPDEYALQLNVHIGKHLRMLCR